MPDGNLHLHLESVKTHGAKDIHLETLSPGHICTIKQFLFQSLTMNFHFWGSILWPYAVTCKARA